jgi:phosphoglycerol transferase MdoB-like AlkP superfamily enzyme
LQPTAVPADSSPEETVVQESAPAALPQAASQESLPAVTADPDAAAPAKDPSVKPNIIAIMCESYADLTCVADFATSQEVTPFYDSISDNVIKGNLYVSTYGGGTANSEFEFLTALMAFLPTGDPVSQYSDSRPVLSRDPSSDGYSLCGSSV